MAAHKGFGKIFRAFQACAGGTRPDKGNVLQLRPTAKIIYNAFYEWRFGAYDDHIYFIFNDEASHFEKLHRVERHASRYFGHSGITRGYKQTVQFFALRDFPRQCVFAASATQK